jgi:ribosome-binding factor A
MKRDTNRMDRLSDLIQNALSEIIHREVNDPRVGMLTIESVKVAKDLSHANVYISTLDHEKAPQTVLALNRASGFLRTQLSQKVKLRVVPALFFRYDETMEKADRLTRLINQALEKDNKKPEQAPDKEES